MSHDSNDSSITSSSSSSPQLGQKRQLPIFEEPKSPLERLLPDLTRLYIEMKKSVKIATIRDLREITRFRKENINETERLLLSKYGLKYLGKEKRPTQVSLTFPLIDSKLMKGIQTMKIGRAKKLLFFEIDGCAVRLSCVEFQASISNYRYSDIITVAYTQNDYKSGNEQCNVFMNIITHYLEKNNRIAFFDDQDTILVAFTLGTIKAYHSIRDIRYPRHRQIDSLHEDFVGHNMVDCFQLLFDHLQFDKKFKIVTILGVGSSDILALNAFRRRNERLQDKVEICFSCLHGVSIGVFGEFEELKRNFGIDFDEFGTHSILVEWQSIITRIEEHERYIFDGSRMRKEEVFAYLACPAYNNEMLEFYLLRIIANERLQTQNSRFKIGFEEFDAFLEGVDIAEIFHEADFVRIKFDIIRYAQVLIQRACFYASVAFLASTEQIFYKEIEPRFGFGQTPEVNVLMRNSFYVVARNFHERLKITLTDLASQLWTGRRTDYERPRFNFIREKDAEIVGICLSALYHSRLM